MAPKFWFAFVIFALGSPILTTADEPKSPAAARPKRLLMLGQKPDSHPKSTHEYMAGCRLIAKYLERQRGIQVVVVQADSPWEDGPELLDGADGAFLFLSEGAKWVSADDRRLAAFQRLARRGGALSCLHWGMGTKDAAPVGNYISLFGGCHGGPDRKYKYADFTFSPIATRHPIVSGVGPVEVHEEFYYNLKFPTDEAGHTKLVQAHIDGVDYAVSWAWERPAGGRSFGFTGMHYHENWKRLEYRRLVVQGILWTLNEPIPATGLDLELAETDLVLP